MAPVDPTLAVAAAAVVVLVLVRLTGRRPAVHPLRRAGLRRTTTFRFWSPWRFYLAAFAVALLLAALDDATAARPADSSPAPATTAGVTP